MSSQNIQTYKVVLLGDKNSGKRSLLQHAFDVPARSSDFYMPIEFTEVNGKNADGQVKTFFFDSLVNTKMIQEQDSSCVDFFATEVLTNARAVLLCFSCANEDSLDNVIMWSRLARKHINPSTHIYLVGTKFDGATTVDDDAYEHVRDSLGHIQGDYRTSIITGENVKALFARVFNGFTELPLTMNKTELTLSMLRTPTKFNLSASKLNMSNLSMSKIHEEPAAATKRGGSSYGITLTSPKGTTSLRAIPQEGASLPEMVTPQKDAKNPSFNITISKIFGRGNTAGRGFDNTLDTSLGHVICNHVECRQQNHNRTMPSRIFGPAKKYNGEDEMFSSKSCLYRDRDNSVSRGYLNNSFSMRHSRTSVGRANHLFSKLAPKYLEEDRTQLDDETLDESAIRGSSGKKVKVVLPNNRILNDSIILDIEGKDIDKTPKFEVSEIKEDSRYHTIANNNNQDSKYVLKVFF
jgi:hypothetical protein